jgi:hypothetical protein
MDRDHAGPARDEEWWAQLAPTDPVDIVNEEWPPGETARFLPDQQDPVQVEARVVWPDGSVEWIRGRATKWLRPVALVELHDSRRRRVWLPAADVRRAAETPPRNTPPVSTLKARLRPADTSGESEHPSSPNPKGTHDG